MNGQNEKISTKFYLAYDIAELPIGTRFLRNPPHVTLAPPAQATEQVLMEAGEAVDHIASETAPFQVTSEGVMFVGHRDEPTPATRFHSLEAAVLHKRLVESLGELGCQFVSLDYALDGYTPHCEALLLDPGERLGVDAITLYIKRNHPQIRGLTEVIDRYPLVRVT